MAVRQYVGARYVPKFADPVAWQANTAYEALIVVTYNNSSYTSKIPVPASVGNPAQNPTYWVCTGNYNAQVEDYRQTTLQVREEADEINNTLSNLPVYPKIIFIGDSYATGEGPDSSTTPWPNIVARYLGLTQNTDYWVGAKGGASWAGIDGRPSFLSLLQTLEDSITNKNIITNIIVCGGVNDAIGTVSDGLTAQGNFYNYVRTNYPNAKIQIGLIGWGLSASERSSVLQVSFPLYTRSYIGETLNLGIPLLRGTGSGDFQSDHIHPTQQGQNILGWCIKSAMLGGIGAFTDTPHELTVSPSSLFKSGMHYFVFDNAHTHSNIFNHQAINFADNAEFPGWATDFEIGTVTDINNDFINGVYFQVNGVLGWNDGSTHETPVTICMKKQGATWTGRFIGDYTIHPTGLVYLVIGSSTVTLDNSISK